MLVAGSAVAQCQQPLHMADIPYPKNSSYFNSQYNAQLEAIIGAEHPSEGYLLLEFPVTKQQKDEQSRQYNMWLAGKRLTRIKQFLTNAEYPFPVITRILTASTEELRQVSISWCATETSPQLAQSSSQPQLP
ncbi:hypothetical protein [Shewanella waksmanii]|uniref:hypothetical protein n=1 Tax=Shewanella waksmanii TaxID=213783 RepID=UPI0037364839